MSLNGRLSIAGFQLPGGPWSGPDRCPQGFFAGLLGLYQQATSLCSIAMTPLPVSASFSKAHSDMSLKERNKEKRAERGMRGQRVRMQVMGQGGQQPYVDHLLHAQAG